MKRFLHIVLFYLKWSLYFIITIGERDRYMEGKMKGMECIKIETGAFSTTTTFDPRNKPKRNYSTFKEYKKEYYPKKI